METEKSLIPNSTQIPNSLLDLLVPRLPEAESRCIIYIARRTFGFHKERDRISFSQFEKGIKSRDGVVLDYGTGLSRPSVAEALRNLDGSRAIETIKTRAGNHYKINLEMDINEVVKRVNQLRELTRTGKATQPRQVKLLNLQNKGNKGNKVLTGASTGKLNDIEKLTKFYFEIKMLNGSTERPERYFRTAGQILSLCNNDLEEAMQKIIMTELWANNKGINWGMDTTVEKFLEINLKQ